MNVTLVSSLFNFNKSPLNCYLISRIIYFSDMFFLLISETQKDMRQLFVTGASFYYLRMLVSLTQYRGALGIFNTLKSILQHSRKTFSSLNDVNINSFQNYPLSTFILLVFSISGVETWWSQNLQETFCLVSFSNRFFAKHFFLTANSTLFEPLNHISILVI